MTEPSDLMMTLEGILRKQSLIYTVDGNDLRLTFDGEPPTAVHLQIAGDLPGVALMAHAPLRLGIHLDDKARQWVLERSGNLLFGRIDLFAIDEDPKLGNVVFSYSTLAEGMTAETVGFLLALAISTSASLQTELGDRFGGTPVLE